MRSLAGRYHGISLRTTRRPNLRPGCYIAAIQHRQVVRNKAKPRQLHHLHGRHYRLNRSAPSTYRVNLLASRELHHRWRDRTARHRVRADLQTPQPATPQPHHLALWARAAYAAAILWPLRGRALVHEIGSLQVQSRCRSRPIQVPRQETLQGATQRNGLW